MALVKFDPNQKDDFPYFDQEGQWGPGCDVEAHCTIEDYEFPTANNPAYDKEGLEGPYACFSLLAVRDGQQNIRENWFCKTGQAWRTLAKLGVEIDDDGNHDTDDVAGRDIIIVAGAPRESKKTAGQFFSTIRTILPA